MNLISLYEIAKNPEEFLKKLHEIKLIPIEKECPNCKNQMNICPRNDYPEKFAWRCRSKYQPSPKVSSKQCDTMTSMRDGTFFGKFEGFGGGSNLNMFQVNILPPTPTLPYGWHWI